MYDRNMKFIILVIIFINIFDGKGVKKDKNKEKEKETVNINKDDYCQGCIESVNIYASRLVNGLTKYQANSVAQGSTLAAESAIDRICDDEHFDNFNIGLKYACIRVVGDNSSLFMSNFEGKFNKNFDKIKGVMYDFKKKICFEQFKACGISTFNKGNITSKMRNKCSACHIIADDIDISIKKYIYKYAKSKDKSTGKVEDIVENVCNNIGFNHSPYSWIENYCEDMIEDKFSTIVEASTFRKKLYHTKFKPDDSFSDSLCEELYKCKKTTPTKSEL